MKRSGTTRDIVRGSMWSAREGVGTALVITVNLGFVVYEDETGRARTTLASRFRDRFEPPYDPREWRPRFCMSLANLLSFHAFWSERERRMYARTASKSIDDCYQPSRGRGGAVPRDAFYVGTYAIPASSDDFLEDLNDKLAERRSNATAA